MRISILGALVFAILTGSTWGQNVRIDEAAKIYKPKMPPTQAERDRRESLRRYVDGLLFEREDRYQDALKAFEDAARLDPKSSAPVKAQVPILAAMLRLNDALDACKQVITIDPEDYLIWYSQAKLLRRFFKYPEAMAALERAIQCEAMHDHPEAAQQIYFELGELHENAGKFGPAADAYNKAAAILEHPDLIMRKGPFPREAILARAAETYEKISQLYRKEKQYDKAIDALTKAQKRSPDRADRINYHLAELCQEKGDLKQAVVFLDAFLRTQPLSLDPYELKIAFLRRLQQTDAILPWLEGVAERDKNNAGLQRLLAKEYANAKQLPKAEAIYKQQAEDAPNAEIYRGLFHLYKLEGPPGMARILTMLDKVLEKGAAANGPASHDNIQQGRAMVGALRDDGELAKLLVVAASGRTDNANAELKFDTVYFLALLADKHHKNDEAERFYRRCLADKAAAPGSDAALYGGLLRALGRGRKYEAIIEVCKQGLQKAKATSPLLFYSEMARAQAGLHHYDEALRTADRGIDAGSDRKLVFRTLRVRIQAMADRYDVAEKECLALLDTYKQADDVLEIRYLLSNVYSASKQHAKSEDQLQLILKIDPFNPTVNNDLGYQWADQGKNLDVAEDMIRKAIELDRIIRRKNANFSAADDKDNAAYIDSLGWVLFRRGQIEEARRELEKATTLGDGDDPVIYDHLGDVYQRLRLNAEAARARQRAIELYDTGIRGKDEERVKDLHRKIDKAKEEVGGRQNMDHDQRIKTVLRAFFADFLRLFFAEWAARMDLSQIEWLDKELLPYPAEGPRYLLDMVARIGSTQPVAGVHAETPWLVLVHIEIESADQTARLKPRLPHYYHHLRAAHGLPVLPIVVYLNVQLDGIGSDSHSEWFWELEVNTFRYLYVGLPGLDGVKYVQAENWLGVALAALMRIPPERVAWLGG